LIERQWRIAQVRRDLPRSTGTLEARLGEWLAPLRRRAGRWQNARRLNLVLGLMTVRGRGAAHEARYTALIRARLAATDERFHIPDVAGSRATDEPARPMSWWRTWHDRGEPSLPRLVFEPDERTRRRVDDDIMPGSASAWREWPRPRPSGGQAEATSRPGR
jgi:hypothetical protein